MESAIRFSLCGNGATLKADPCIGVRKTSRFSSIQPHERLPEWLRRPLGEASAIERVQGLVKSNALHTICEEGRCPNLSLIHI